MKHSYRIEAGRLVLRPVEEKDIEIIRNWRNIDSIRKSFIYQGIISAPQQKEWYRKYCANDHDIMFMIEYLSKSVGTVALYDINLQEGTAEFGRIMIGDLEARGKRIGINATECLCKFGFEKLHLNEIRLEVFSDNIYAISIYQEIGFRREKETTSERIIKMTLKYEDLYKQTKNIRSVIEGYNGI